MTEPVFITGATGLLGASLARAIAASGASVRILVRGTLHPFLEKLPVDVVRGDLSDRVALARAMDGCSHAYHVAGLVSYRNRDRDLLLATNVDGTRNLLAAAADAGVRRVLHTSSIAAIGYSLTPDEIRDEDSTFMPHFHRDPYMHSKNLAELEVENALQRGLDVVTVNPATIFGAGDVKGNTTAIFPRIARGKVRAAPPGGTSVVSVDDVVEGMLLAMKNGLTGRRYVLAAEQLTFLELFNRIAAVTGARPLTRTIPRVLETPLALFASAAGALLPNFPMSPSVIHFTFAWRFYSSARARTELGWSPKKPIDVALREAYNFIRERGAAIRGG